MLHAIITNKAGKNLSKSEVYWRDLFSTSEDSLTAMIFGRLLYLPSELIWEILNSASYSERLTTGYPKILSAEFWPRWVSDETSKSKSVEPDIFIRTTEFDLIIEAKRYDDNQQDAAQWQNECQAYLNEYGEEDRKVILLAIGGINNEQDEIITISNKNISVIKCRWIKLLHEIKKIHLRLEKNSSQLNSINSLIVILKDIVSGFGIHGYSTGGWLEDENFDKLTPIKRINFSTL